MNRSLRVKSSAPVKNIRDADLFRFSWKCSNNVRPNSSTGYITLKGAKQG